MNGTYTATAIYKTNLNSTALGTLSSNAFTANIYAIYNSGANNDGSDYMVQLTTTVKDAQCCGAFVAPGVYKQFMCHNMGADTSLDPNIPSEGITGDYYQFGRNTPAAYGLTYGAGIAVPGWQFTAELWNSWGSTAGIKEVNDPCPTGYRLIDETDMAGVLANNTIITYGSWVNNSYSSLRIGPNSTSYTLSLPATGYRAGATGKLQTYGNSLYYWLKPTSVTTSQNAAPMLFKNISSMSLNQNSTNVGMTIRCIQE